MNAGPVLIHIVNFVMFFWYTAGCMKLNADVPILHGYNFQCRIKTKSMYYTVLIVYFFNFIKGLAINARIQQIVIKLRVKLASIPGRRKSVRGAGIEARVKCVL